MDTRSSPKYFLNDCRSDISARELCSRGQRAFFNIRVFDPNAQRHESKTLRQCYEMNKQEKKRENTIREFRTLNKELLYHSCFQLPE